MFCRGVLYPRHPLVKLSTRSLAAVSSTFDARAGTVGPFQVFDRNTKRLQKDRAASRDGGARSRTVDYVRDEVADRMMDRLLVLVMWPFRVSEVNGSFCDRTYDDNSILL
jgi:hypothetical protein